MTTYILRRLLLVVPTLFGVTLVSFVLINLAPGSPIEIKLRQARMSGVTGATSDVGVSQEVIEALNRQYGFDKPVLYRYGKWLANLAHLDFGESFAYDEPVTALIVEKLPVSFFFGLAALAMILLICVPLGVYKAVRGGSAFDKISSVALFLTYSIPAVMLGVLLLVFFAGSGYFNWFPISGTHSDAFAELPFFARALDLIRHAVLPVACYSVASFAFVTLLVRNAVSEAAGQDYARTARAKGLSEWRIYLKHVLRNSLLPIVTAATGLVGTYLAGSIIVETIFNLDGIGLLAFKSIGSRDYNVLMGLIFFQSLLLILVRLGADLLYAAIDPRIDYR